MVRGLLLAMAAYAALCGLAPSTSAAPPTPAAAEVLEATGFTLGQPLALSTGAVREGLVIVVRSTPDMTRPRQEAMPVPQCGPRLAMAASRGADGLLVAIVFGPASLATDAVFFSAPELPSRLNSDDLARREAEALSAGVRPMGEEAAGRALAAGAGTLHLRSFDDLAPFLFMLRCRIEPQELAAAGVPCPDAP